MIGTTVSRYVPSSEAGSLDPRSKGVRLFFSAGLAVAHADEIQDAIEAE